MFSPLPVVAGIAAGGLLGASIAGAPGLILGAGLGYAASQPYYGSNTVYYYNYSSTHSSPSFSPALIDRVSKLQSLESLARFCQTDSQLNQVCSNNEFWRKVTQKRFPNITSLPMTTIPGANRPITNWREYYQWLTGGDNLYYTYLPVTIKVVSEGKMPTGREILKDLHEYDGSTLMEAEVPGVGVVPIATLNISFPNEMQDTFDGIVKIAATDAMYLPKTFPRMEVGEAGKGYYYLITSK
jgi:hypothetical protein